MSENYWTFESLSDSDCAIHKSFAPIHPSIHVSLYLYASFIIAVAEKQAHLEPRMSTYCSHLSHSSETLLFRTSNTLDQVGDDVTSKLGSMSFSRLKSWISLMRRSVSLSLSLSLIKGICKFAKYLFIKLSQRSNCCNSSPRQEGWTLILPRLISHSKWPLQL